MLCFSFCAILIYFTISLWSLWSPFFLCVKKKSDHNDQLLPLRHFLHFTISLCSLFTPFFLCVKKNQFIMVIYFLCAILYTLPSLCGLCVLRFSSVLKKNRVTMVNYFLCAINCTLPSLCGLCGLCFFSVLKKKQFTLILSVVNYPMEIL